MFKRYGSVAALVALPMLQSCDDPRTSESSVEPRAQLAAASVSSSAAELVRGALHTTGAPQGALTLVLVLDGLRPDSINPEDTPNLHALRTDGVTFPASHAVFPTVTRVNASSIATGRYPEHSGIIGNSIYVPELDPLKPINTGDFEQLLALDRASGGRLLLAESLGEVLQRHGKKLAVVSSGSTGSALLLNHRAPEGVGVLINGYFDPGKTVGFPAEVSDAVRARFGDAPASTEAGKEATDWAETVLCEYVLPELKPDVVVNWITQPDGAQHAHGAGSPEALEVIRNDDRNIGRILDKLRELGLYDKTNVIVVSDHGFGVYSQQINLTESLVAAGVKQSASSTDVVLASQGQAVMVHVDGHDPARIAAIVRHLQQQPAVDAIFTRGRGGAEGVPVQGSAPGTFSLELIHHAQQERGADVVVTFKWTSERNRFGVQGTDTRDVSGDQQTGPVSGDAAGHGSMSPWTVRNTWFAWGVDFRDRTFSPLPVGNVDIYPTVLHLAGIEGHTSDGRVIAEALVGGPDPEKLPIDTRTHLTSSSEGDYAAAIQVTELGSYRYVDKSYRIDLPRQE